MPNAKKLKEPVVTVRIVEGTMNPWRIRLWHTFWARLFAEVQSESKAEDEVKND